MRCCLLALLIVGLISLRAAEARLPAKSVAAMTAAAQDFLSSLDEGQRKLVAHKYEEEARTDFHWVPKETRKGLQLRDMKPEQRNKALALLKACLGEQGFAKAEQIMRMEDILLKAEGGKSHVRDPLRYFVTIFGEPTDKLGKWAFSFEGHHLSVNMALSDGEIVGSTPTFFGCNPAVVSNDYGVGPDRGTRVLAQEETVPFELLKSLDDEQRKIAKVAEAAPADFTSAGKAHAEAGEPRGLSASKMTDSQRALLRKLLAEFAGNTNSDAAAARMKEIDAAGIDKLYFAWSGGEQQGEGYAWVVQGPTLVLGLINVQPDPAGNANNHVHSLWRSLTSDFGEKQ